MGHIGDLVTLNNPAFIHDTALLYGKISIGEGSSVWPYVVMRCEAAEIRIGKMSNIQDFVMIHYGSGSPTIVGDYCSITHHATLHGCEIGDHCLIGINATIMDNAKIGAGSIVAGNAIVTEGAVFPPNSVIGGVPAKRLAERDNSKANIMNAHFYHEIARGYAEGRERLDDEAQARLKKLAEE
ncbi:MAG: gamma carbonic anhydrase family protein [Pseudomonadales bacterium]|nr:gamma carbonic anhydrase family protein [Pseudomonadales bacterium]